MVVWATLLFLQGVSIVGSTTEITGVPENITVMFINPTSVRVSWTSQLSHVDKYDVTYKPTDARVVAVVAGNSEDVMLSNLRADTQYQLVVTAVKNGKKLRSRPIVFRTLEQNRSYSQPDTSVTEDFLSSPSSPLAQQPDTYVQVRGVEIGIVLLVLMVWVGAIALFFNRWGKIRMLLPYQPDYKEQLKVPGTGVSNSANSTYNNNTSQVCSQELTKNQGSISRYSRKVCSAENLPFASSNQLFFDIRQDIGTTTNQDSLLNSISNDSEKKKTDVKKQSSLDSMKNKPLSIDPCLTQHLSLRELNHSSRSATPIVTNITDLSSLRPITVTVISGPSSFLPSQTSQVEKNSIDCPTQPQNSFIEYGCVIQGESETLINES